MKEKKGSAHGDYASYNKNQKKSSEESALLRV